MKKRAVFTVGLLFLAGILLWRHRPQRDSAYDPFSVFKQPFVCTVEGEIEDFAFAFDVQSHQNCLQLTLTKPASLAGIRAQLSAGAIFLYKGDVQVQTGGSLQGLVASLFQNTGAKISSSKKYIVAQGSDQNGDYEIKFDKNTLFPIQIAYKNAKITAEIKNFAPAAD